MTAREFWFAILTAVVSAILGGGGIVGIVFHFTKRYFDKKLETEEKKSAEARDFRQKKAACEERMTHALGRWVFWMNRWVETGDHNGELRAAFEDYQKAEKDKKELDREIVVKFEQQQKKG